MSVRSLNYIVAKAREKREAPSSGQLGIRRPANKINHNCDADTQNKKRKMECVAIELLATHTQILCFFHSFPINSSTKLDTLGDKRIGTV